MSGMGERSARRPDHIVLALDDDTALGGVQRVVWTLADELTDLGVRVTILSLHASDRTPMAHRHPTEVVRLRDAAPTLPYVPLRAHQRLRLGLRGRYGGVREFDADVRRLRSLAQRWRSPGTVVIAMQLQAAEYLVAAGVDVPMAVQYHDAFEAAQAWDVPRLRRLSSHVTALLCLNAEDARSFGSVGLPMEYQRNPVAPATATPAADRDPVVVAAGRFEHQKAYEVLVQAWRLIADQHPQWRLVIYGEGSLRDALIAAAADLPTVWIEPTTDRWGEVLATAGLHALSSRHEGMALVITEAMAAGLPTVATDCGAGVRELVVPGTTGLLVPNGDPEALGRALGSLMADETTRLAMGRQARDRVGDYAPATVAREWLERADRWLRGRPPTPSSEGDPSSYREDSTSLYTPEEINVGYLSSDQCRGDFNCEQSVRGGSHDSGES